MERRRFLALFGAGVAGIAIEQAVPFGRVWSFPSKIVVGRTMRIRQPPRWMPFSGVDFATADSVTFFGYARSPGGFGGDAPVKAGDIITIAPYPQKFRVTAVCESGFSLVTAI